MKDGITNFVKLMDQKNWVRMAVLFAPGIVLGKLFAMANAPLAFQTGGTIVLIIGAFIWLMWAPLRKRIFEQESGSEVTQTDEDRFAELTTRCSSDDVDPESLVLMELRLNPELNYSQALELALKRKRLQ